MLRVVRSTILISGVLVALSIGARVALADWGTYNDRNGVPCSYTGSGNLYHVMCSGIAMPSGQFVSYSCDYTFIGQNSWSWNCRSFDGATWSGSR